MRRLVIFIISLITRYFKKWKFCLLADFFEITAKAKHAKHEFIFDICQYIKKLGTADTPINFEWNICMFPSDLHHIWRESCLVLKKIINKFLFLLARVTKIMLSIT